MDVSKQASETQIPFIYEYRDPVAYLSDYLYWHKKRDPSFTLRKWAYSMGINDPETLISILRKKKKLRSRHVDFIRKGVRLDDTEIFYFQLLIQHANAENEDDRKMFETLLLEHSPGNDTKTFRVENPEIFSNWINMAILSMCRIQTREINRESIGKLFIKNVNLEAIHASIDLLLRSGLIVEDKNGRLVRTSTSVSGWTNQENKGARNYYEQVSELAKEAIDMEMLSREFQCFSLALDKAKIPQAKELIRNFRNTLSALSDENANEVYQVNLQCFPLTDSTRMK